MKIKEEERADVERFNTISRIKESMRKCEKKEMKKKENDK